jgi:hypothetical protein
VATRLQLLVTLLLFSQHLMHQAQLFVLLKN